jgi:hypothetical protein
MSNNFNCFNEIITNLKAGIEANFNKSTEFYHQAHLNVENFEKILDQMKQVIFKNVLLIIFIKIEP